MTRTEYFRDRSKESIEIETENDDSSEDFLNAPAESRRKRPYGAFEVYYEDKAGT